MHSLQGLCRIGISLSLKRCIDGADVQRSSAAIFLILVCQTNTGTFPMHVSRDILRRPLQPFSPATVVVRPRESTELVECEPPSNTDSQQCDVVRRQHSLLMYAMHVFVFKYPEKLSIANVIQLGIAVECNALHFGHRSFLFAPSAATSFLLLFRHQLFYLLPVDVVVAVDGWMLVINGKHALAQLHVVFVFLLFDVVVVPCVCANRKFRGGACTLYMYTMFVRISGGFSGFRFPQWHCSAYHFPSMHIMFACFCMPSFTLSLSLSLLHIQFFYELNVQCRYAFTIFSIETGEVLSLSLLPIAI